MALVMMAMLFMLDERIRHEDTWPLLSCSDIKELLAHFLPRRDIPSEKSSVSLSTAAESEEVQASRRQAPCVAVGTEL